MTAPAVPPVTPTAPPAGAEAVDWRPILIVLAGVVVLYLLTRAAPAPAAVKEAAPADVKE